MYGFIGGGKMSSSAKHGSTAFVTGLPLNPQRLKQRTKPIEKMVGAIIYC